MGAKGGRLIAVGPPSGKFAVTKGTPAAKPISPASSSLNGGSGRYRHGRSMNLADIFNFASYPGFWKFAARNLPATLRELKTVVSEASFVRNNSSDHTRYRHDFLHCGFFECWAQYAINL